MTLTNTTCPQCGGPMTSRKNRATGQFFWGCANFPTCKGTRNTDGEAPNRRDEDASAERDDAMPSDRARRNDRARWRDA